MDSSLPLDYRANPTRLRLWLVGLGLFLGNHLGRAMSIRTTVDVVFMSFKLFLILIQYFDAKSKVPDDKVDSDIGLRSTLA